MSSANISSGPANCMKFNSSFLFYIGFFVLLVIGYMWGKRNGTKEERIRDAKSDAKKKGAVTDSSEESLEEKAKSKVGKASKAASKGAAAASKGAAAASKGASKAASKVGEKIKSIGKK
jgi:hypothetical protein